MVIITQHGDFLKKAKAKRAVVSSKRRELEVRLNPNYFPGTRASDLANLIDRFQGNLERMTLSFQYFFGASPVFEESVARCRNLREFHFEVAASSSSGINMEGLGKALEQMPALEAVTLVQNLEFLTPLLLRSNSVLRKVVIKEDDYYPPGSPTRNERMQQFFEACQTSTKLQELTFCAYDGYLRSSHLTWLGQVIRHSCSLEYLEFSHEDKSLRYLEMALWGDAYNPPAGEESEKPGSLECLAGDLKHSQTVKRVKIAGWSGVVSPSRENEAEDEAEAAAFYETLQHNYTLQKLEGFRLTPMGYRVAENSKIIDHLLALNRFGRSKLLKPGSKLNTNEWIDAIANEGDLSVTYYFLRNNPSLCTTNIKESSLLGRLERHGPSKRAKRAKAGTIGPDKRPKTSRQARH